MGLAKYFATAPIRPEPHVTRTISTSQSTYDPGSQIAGSLGLQCPAQRHLIRIEASFHGTCITHTTRTENSGTGDNKSSTTIRYRDDAPLFRHTQILDKNVLVQPGQCCSWPFNFTFPFESTNLRGEVYRVETACSPMYQVLPHSLPPTFSSSCSHSTYAQVEYNVEAILYFEDDPEPFTIKFEQINFSPLPPQPPLRTPFIEHLRNVEKYTSSRLAGQEKSFRNSFRDKFSSSTPSVTVLIKVSVPSVVTTGNTFALFVCAELSDLSDPYAIDVPEVQFRIKSLKVVKSTRLRAMRYSGISVHTEHETDYSLSAPLNTLPDARTAASQLGDHKQLVFPASFEARVPGDCGATFSTVSINYSCSLKVVVEAEVCGKTFEHKFEMLHFTVLPG